MVNIDDITGTKHLPPVEVKPFTNDHRPLADLVRETPSKVSVAESYFKEDRKGFAQRHSFHQMYSDFRRIWNRQLLTVKCSCSGDKLAQDLRPTLFASFLFVVGREAGTLMFSFRKSDSHYVLRMIHGAHVCACVYDVDPFPSASRAAPCFCNDGEARACSNSHGGGHCARPGKTPTCEEHTPRSLIIGSYIMISGDRTPEFFFRCCSMIVFPFA